jgi:hypothetical protein
MKRDIAKRVNLDDVSFQLAGRKTGVFVSFSLSSKRLFFNANVVNELRLREWKQCLVGIDRKTGIIVLKKCTAEEYGSVQVVLYKRNAYHICIGALVRLEESLLGKAYAAEREGNLIYLERVDKKERSTK